MKLSKSQIEGILTILTAASAPFGVYAAGTIDLRAAVILSVVAGIATAKAWHAESPRSRRERKDREAANGK